MNIIGKYRPILLNWKILFFVLGIEGYAVKPLQINVRSSQIRDLYQIGYEDMDRYSSPTHRDLNNIEQPLATASIKTF